MTLRTSAAPPPPPIGASNTLTFERGRIAADNTDAGGLLDALGRAGRRAPRAGAGRRRRGARRRLGAAMRPGRTWRSGIGRRRARIALARELGARAVERPQPADLLVNATSVGLEPGGRQEALEALGLHGYDPPATLVDLVYGDAPTALCGWAERGGARVVDGLEVLVRQGARSFELLDRGEAPARCDATCSRERGRLGHLAPEVNAWARGADTKAHGGPAPNPSRPYRHHPPRGDVLRFPERARDRLRAVGDTRRAGQAGRAARGGTRPAAEGRAHRTRRRQGDPQPRQALEERQARASPRGPGGRRQARPRGVRHLPGVPRRRRHQAAQLRPQRTHAGQRQARLIRRAVRRRTRLPHRGRHRLSLQGRGGKGSREDPHRRRSRPRGPAGFRARGPSTPQAGSRT